MGLIRKDLKYRMKRILHYGQMPGISSPHLFFLSLRKTNRYKFRHIKNNSSINFEAMYISADSTSVSLVYRTWEMMF